MNRTTTRRSQIARTTAAALTAVAALALTACTEDGGGTKTEGKATSSASATGSQGATGGSGGTGGGNTQQPAGGEQASGGQASEGTNGAPEKDKAGNKENSTSGQNGKATEGAEANASIADCSPLSMNMAVQSVKRPINHLLLQATNESDAPCAIYGYPYLGFGEDAQSTVVPLESSKPQSVLVLKPGQTAYAGIMTSSADGSGAEGYDADSVTVYLSNSQQDGSLDEETTLKLPQSTYVDSSAWVSYWQSNVDDAIS